MMIDTPTSFDIPENEREVLRQFDRPFKLVDNLNLPRAKPHAVIIVKNNHVINLSRKQNKHGFRKFKFLIKCVILLKNKNLI